MSDSLQQLLAELLKANGGKALQSQHFTGLHGAALSYTLAKCFQTLQRPLFLVVPDQEEALRLEEELNFFLGGEELIQIFPPLGILPYYGLNPSAEVMAERMAFLNTLLHRKTPFVGIASVSAIMRRLPPQEIFQKYSDYWVVGEEIDRDDLLKKLVQAGYQNVPLVEDSGTFSARGGIVDVFSPGQDQPVRFEFFGDQLESLRYFDPQTQRSGQEREDFVLVPARDIVFEKSTLGKVSLRFRERANAVGLDKEEREFFLENLKQAWMPPAFATYLPLFYDSTTTLFSYLPKNCLGVWIEPQDCESHLEKLTGEIQNAYEACTSTERVITPNELFLDWQELKNAKQQSPSWIFTLLAQEEFGKALHLPTEGHETLSAVLQHAHLSESMLAPLTERLREWRKQGIQVILVASSEAQRLRLQDLLTGQGLTVQKLSGSVLDFSPSQSGSQVFLTEGPLSKGFLWLEERLALLTDQEIFGAKKRRQRVGKRAVETFTTFEELHEGDYIVHEEHGLGVYRGLNTLDLEGYANDFLLIEYLGQDKLYLPVYRLNLVSRYSGPEGHVPRLDKMGGTSWEKAKEKVRQELQVLASELLKLYAERSVLPGHAFSARGALYEEFEATFPFQETPDQLKAIQAVNRDMDTSRPMDRLICGDVGFGKTEVAMRAAFRAVLDQKQVALLVPTTVLALQHERNLRSRFQQYPVVVETLSRFSTPKKQRETLEKLTKGQVDIVVGTHALLSPSVQFKDLGLLIVDEEHRFGVAQKEKIKKLKSQADVLTLTATPIPRTLNMSLSGIRDLSLIATPPVDRMAIQTLVAHDNDALIQEAIRRELARGGQVYFVHNRVKSIDRLHKRLKKLLPEAKIAVGHGQMSERELEEVMIRFLSREFNVFLCTTIVESGLDVPSANTMIINRADTLGLAQLYQLRGRIGRSNVRAHAYLLTPSESQMTPKARQRLSVLQRYSELGSGFKIAAHDLEIRGGGNLLGAEQSGHITTMGYELYMRLLEEAIAVAKGEAQKQAPEPELQLKLSASIPESYLPEMRMRLSLYKRFASVETEEDLEALSEETRDRFGELPQEMKNLITLMRVKQLAKRQWIRSISLQDKQVVIVFDPQSPLDVDRLMAQIAKEPERLRWLKPHELAMGFKAGKEDKAIESLIGFLLKL